MEFLLLVKRWQIYGLLKVNFPKSTLSFSETTCNPGFLKTTSFRPLLENFSHKTLEPYLIKNNETLNISPV